MATCPGSGLSSRRYSATLLQREMPVLVHRDLGVVDGPRQICSKRGQRFSRQTRELTDSHLN